MPQDIPALLRQVAAFVRLTKEFAFRASVTSVEDAPLEGRLIEAARILETALCAAMEELADPVPVPVPVDEVKRQSLRDAVVPILAAVGFEEIPSDYPDFEDEVVIATSQQQCIMVDRRTHFGVAYYGPITVIRPDGTSEPHPTEYQYITERVSSELEAREVAAKHVSTCRRVIAELFTAAGFNRDEDSMGGKPPLFERLIADKDGCMFRIQAQARRPGPGSQIINTLDSCFIGDIPSARKVVAYYEDWLAWRKNNVDD